MRAHWLRERDNQTSSTVAVRMHEEEAFPEEKTGGSPSDTPDGYPAPQEEHRISQSATTATSLVRSTSVPLQTAPEPQKSKPDCPELIERCKSVSEIAESAMERIRLLKAGIVAMEERASKTLGSCQNLMDACGDAIAAWFKGLSGAALARAIKEVCPLNFLHCVYAVARQKHFFDLLILFLFIQAFDTFDSDGSELLDRDEFASAMQRLGLRLSNDDYDALFKEYDADASGEIDLVSSGNANSQVTCRCLASKVPASCFEASEFDRMMFLAGRIHPHGQKIFEFTMRGKRLSSVFAYRRQ